MPELRITYSCRPDSLRSQVLLCLFMLYNYLVAVMYCSVIISMLSVMEPPKTVQTLDDLLKPQFKHLRHAYYRVSIRSNLCSTILHQYRVFVSGESMHKFVRHHRLYDDIKERIDFLDRQRF